jgi:hypothetical protein
VIGVVLVDDQALLRTGFRMILDAGADIPSSARPGTASPASRSSVLFGPMSS